MDKRMDLRKIALTTGIAIFMPLIIYYGVRLISPKQLYFESDTAYENISTKEKEEKSLLYENNRKIFNRNIFYVAVTIGLISILLGGYIPNSAIASGLLFGGILSLIFGYASHWSDLLDWLKFISLLIAFMLLIFIGYKKIN